MLEGETGGRDVVLDLEAGLEVMSRATPRYVDVMLAVVEPYYRSLEAGKRVVDLARELEVPRIGAIANKVRTEADAEAISSFCARHGIPLLGTIPYDDTLIEAERAGRAPIDHDPDSPAVTAIRDLAEDLAGAA